MPLGIVAISESRKFKEDYGRQPDKIQKKANRFIGEMLSPNNFTGGRDVHPMRGHRNPTVWEAKITRAIRITFSINSSGVATLRRLGSHDIYNDP